MYRAKRMQFAEMQIISNCYNVTVVSYQAMFTFSIYKNSAEELFFFTRYGYLIPRQYVIISTLARGRVVFSGHFSK